MSCPMSPPRNSNETSSSARGMESQCNILISWLQPTKQSQSRREQVFQFIRSCINGVGVQAELVGSTATRTYLPDDVLDINAFELYSGTDSGEILLKINETLCKHSLSCGSSDAMRVRDIQLVCSERESENQHENQHMIKCMVLNVSVSIRVNDFDEFGKILFLEEANRHIQNDHLLKRSLILIKTWCCHEASKYTPGSAPVMGIMIKEGGLNDYILAMMLLMMLNFEESNDEETKMSELTPLKVLFKWMSFYSNCDWEAITVKAVINQKGEGFGNVCEGSS